MNYPMLEQLLKRQMDAGIRAVVLCGTTGEAPTLSDTEKLEIFRRGKACVGDGCAIIAGTGSNCTAHAAALTAAAQECGVDAALVVSPYYNKATEDGLVTHYSTVAAGVTIPVIAYNVPGRTGVDIPVSVYRKLALVPNIIGVKEASQDITKVTKILGACGPDFGIWSGNDSHTTAAIALGARGVISVTSNICPVLVKAMADAALAGDFDTAAALQLRLDELNETLFCRVNPIPVKAAMKMLGFDCGEPRLPLTALDAGGLERLKKVLEI